ncbi:DUF6059 family protein [Streptomyces sp. NPDC003470]|uniref:DUF6059 family protein n=1 Tax=unclassified Streptomyces TaxID=2593676 RepID=UPI0036629056
MEPVRRSPGARCLRAVWDALVDYGSFWACVPPLPEAAPVRRPALAGPAPAHPERLCPELPLTAVERRLRDQLCDRG